MENQSGGLGRRNILMPRAPATPLSNGTARIVGRNVNGTMVVTSAPMNEAELQLYRVMQRASLLAYYDTLLEMGGDDVQQLCDAGEDEFLEIMSLVGMSSKPLHVRRLQKSLREWMTNPAIFQIPVVPGPCPTLITNPRLVTVNATASNIITAVASPESRPEHTPSPGAPENSCSSNSSAPKSPVLVNQISLAKLVLPPSPAPSTVASRPFSPPNACPPSVDSSPSPTPILLDSHVQKLAAFAEKMSKNLPLLEPKPHNAKKKVNKNLELVMMMPETEPRRMEEIRRFSAIYGRFDCKRNPEKPLTMHEVMVNEAAAQICRHVPALLSRRDELFRLARQLVRKAGLNYSKHSSPCTSADSRDLEECNIARKRPRQVAPFSVDLTD